MYTLGERKEKERGKECKGKKDREDLYRKGRYIQSEQRSFFLKQNVRLLPCRINERAEMHW